MASKDVGSTLDDLLKLLDINTAHPEQFLTLQDGAAADFTSLTKSLYDLHKAHQPPGLKGSPLNLLVVENFDEEQIWQELELQNAAALRHFERVVSEAVSEEGLTLLEEEDEEEEADENRDQEGMCEDEGGEEDEELSRSARRFKKAAGVENVSGDFSDEHSDLDFNVDAFEKKVKAKKLPVSKGKKPRGAPSEVDDKFFKLSDMETFLDDMDRREEKGDEGDEDVDYFQDLPSGEDDLDDDDDELDLDEDLPLIKPPKSSKLKSSRNLKYKDFFDAVEGDPYKPVDQSDADEDDSMGEMQDEEEGVDREGNIEEEEEDFDDEDDDENADFDEDEESRLAKEAFKKVTFNLPGEEEDEGESEGEDLADIIGGKSSQMSSQAEPKSSFEKRQNKMTEKIQELEKAALGEKPWQLSGEVSAETRPENSMLEEDVHFESASRMAPAVTEETTLQLEDIIKQRIKDQVFDDVVRKEKPKENAFEYKKRLTLDQEKSKLSLAQVYEQEYLKLNQQKKEEEENPAHVEIQKLMDALFLKLDALSNFHFTPKPPAPEVKVVSNLPSIAMEEVAPVSVSNATLLAPEEIKEKNKAGDLLGDTEKTATDKKRERRKKKAVKRLKIKERERRLKLKNSSRTEENNKPCKAQVAEDLKKLTKGGRAKLIKDDGKDKALRSSSAFFSQLQDQVKSQIKGIKKPPSKKKQKGVSVSKLKL